MDKQRIEEIRGRCEKASGDLRELLPEKVDYAELVCAEAWAHGVCYVWDSPEPYAMENAANLIDELLAELDRLTAENERLRVERDALREGVERIG